MEKHRDLAKAKVRNRVLLAVYVSAVMSVSAVWLGWLEAEDNRALEARAGRLQVEQARISEETAFLRVQTARLVAELDAGKVSASTTLLNDEGY